MTAHDDIQPYDPTNADPVAVTYRRCELQADRARTADALIPRGGNGHKGSAS